MSDHSQRISELSDERRQLLTRLLQKKGQQYNVFPLSFAQQRMWFLYQSEPQSPFYNVALKLRLKGTLNAPAMERAIGEIVNRHEVLRTTFTSIDGAPVQIVVVPAPVALPVIDLSEMAEAEREAEAERLAIEEAKRPFDLERGPMLRASLLRLDAQQHLLLLCTHHIVVDGWAIGVLLRELSALYEAYVAGVASPLPALKVQYADYARQQQLSGAKLYETHLEYWKKKLNGSQHVLELPCDRPRPSVQTYRGAHQSLSFPGELVESLKSFAQREGVTLFMLLVAGYEALLYRYTGQTDINIGTPVSGRNRAELESLIGLFSNTLILRAELSGSLSFHELLGRVRQTCLEAYTHQDLPFDKLVEVLQPERDPCRHPLVQVTFSLQNEALAQQASLKALKLPGLTVSVEDVETGTVQFDLILTIEHTERELVASFSYNEDLFDAARISRMLAHYKRLLEEAVRAPHTRLCELPLISEEEEESLLLKGSGPRAEYPRDLSLTELFEAQAALTPSATALCFGEATLTFEELERRANRMANYLRAMGLGPEALIGLRLQASEEYVVSVLAILKAGAAIVPLSSTASASELMSQTEGLPLSALLLEEDIAVEVEAALSSATRNGSHALRVLRLEAHRALIIEQSAQRLARPPLPESTAYVLPCATADGKAVCVSHRTVQNRLRWLQDTCPIGSGEAVLHRSLTSTEMSICELLWPLLYGGRSVLCAANESELASLPTVIERQQVKAARLSASEITRCVTDAVGPEGDAVRRQLSSLRCVISTGEPLARTTVEAWRRSMRDTTICECQAIHGTEVLAFLHHKDDAKAKLDETLAPLTEKTAEAQWQRAETSFAGYPINNVTIVVLNEAGRMMPVGASGEICVGGEGLVGIRPFVPLGHDATSEAGFDGEAERGSVQGLNLYGGTGLRWMKNSFAGITGQHLLRTGQRGRWLADGRLRLESLSGQAWIDDHLVVYEEVEAALLAEPYVQECAVRARPGRNGTRLVAYLVNTGRVNTEELSAQLSRRLAAHQIPQLYVQMLALPLTSKGIVDEAALASAPLMEEDEVELLEERIRRVPMVEDVAVVMHEAVEPARTLHLSDLIDDTQSTTRAPFEIEREAGAPVEHEPNSFKDGAHTGAEAVIAGVYAERDPAVQTRQAFCDGGPLRSEHTLPETLYGILHRAAQSSSRGITYLTGADVKQQTYSQLIQSAHQVGSLFSASGAERGSKVILQLDDNRQFLSAFWGCVLAGMVPVPLSTSVSYEQESNSTRMLENVWQMLANPLVVTERKREAEIKQLLERGGAEARVVAIEDVHEVEESQRSVEEIDEDKGEVAEAGAKADDLALLLFTSGSTGKPKGVMLTHRNIIRMSAGIAQLNGYTDREITMNWMPLTHVGGLVMFHLRDVFLSCSQLHARTDDILESPLRWLDFIEQYGVTVTWAPNFAFKLMNEQAALIHQRSWNLSSLRLIANGGEVVNAQTTMTFLSLLAKDALAPTVMRPGFGMSETSSSIISSEILALGSERGLQRVDALNGNRVLRTIEGASRATTFVEVGLPAPGLQVRIVDGENRLLAEDMIGRLQVRGPQVTPGYYENDEANREAFCEDGWFNTGDLGFLHDGRLTVTGREKDVIIVNGANYYGPEIEAIVESIEGVEPSYTAACAVRDGDSDTDRLAIFFHPRAVEKVARKDLIKRIRETVARSAGISPDYVLALEKSEIPKTSIGKIQRSLLKQQFERGGFAAQIKELDLALENSNTLPDWFYQQVWLPKRISHLQPQLSNTCFLIFTDERGLGAQLCAELKRQGRDCISVSPGHSFLRGSREHYSLDPKCPQHYRELIAALSKEGIVPQQVLHLWAYEDESCAGPSALEEAQQRGLFSLLWLVQALAHEGVQRVTESFSNVEDAAAHEATVQLNVVTYQAQAAGSSNTFSAYQHSTLPGLLKSVAIELPWLRVRHMDLETDDARANASRLLEELRAVKGEAEVSYREGERLVARLRKFEMLETERRPLALRRGGLYLVSGGLGGIGSYISEYLLKHYDLKLLLVGRTSLPQPERGPQTFSEDEAENAPALERMGRLRVLEAAGASGSCLYRAADVCDMEGLRAAVEDAELWYGRKLDGVLHLAGEEDLARHWLEMERYWAAAETLAHVSATLSAKLSGTWNLFELLRERESAVFISFSSVNSIFGAATFGAYAAANSFLDGFASYQSAHNQSVQTWNFNWTVWDGLGMSAGGPEYTREVARSLGYCVMGAQQGLFSLLAGLSRQPMNLVVGLDGKHEQVRKRLQSRSEASHRLVAFYTTRSDDEVAQSYLSEAANSFQLETNTSIEFQEVKSFARKDDGSIDKDELLEETLGSARAEAFHAPQGEVEKQLLDVWKKVLEVERVGVNDKFFEVGGNSLKSLRLLSAINRRFSCQVAVADLFKFSTVKTLSSHIEKLTFSSTGRGENNISGFEL